MSFWFALLVAVLCGAVEAILWCRQGAEAFAGNEHGFLVVQRAMIVLAIGSAVVDVQHWATWPALLADLGAFVLAFSFAHNNAYNFNRVWIDMDDQVAKWAAAGGPNYHVNVDKLAFRQAWSKFQWNYQSATSSARFDFTAKERNLMAIAGVVVYGLAFWRPYAGLVGAAVCLLWLAVYWQLARHARQAAAKLLAESKKLTNA